jgi:hypothetical protein
MTKLDRLLKKWERGLLNVEELDTELRELVNNGECSLHVAYEVMYNAARYAYSKIYGGDDE